MSRQPLQIQLGIRLRTFFTYARTNARLLGTVRDGMQIGVLAQMRDGSYVQINGDVVRVLNASRVKHALARVTDKTSRSPMRLGTLPPSTVTVTVKRRRPVQRPVA
jgi:hypothetical protein